MSTSSCPKGKIKRKAYQRAAYKRSDGTRVKATKVPAACIKDRGLPGKTKKNIIGPLKKDILGKYGYEDIDEKSDLSRHRALGKAHRSKKESDLSVYRRLIALSTLNKRTNPKVSKILRNDAKWYKDKYLSK